RSSGGSLAVATGEEQYRRIRNGARHPADNHHVASLLPNGKRSAAGALNNAPRQRRAPERARRLQRVVSLPFISASSSSHGEHGARRAPGSYPLAHRKTRRKGSV